MLLERVIRKKLGDSLWRRIINHEVICDVMLCVGKLRQAACRSSKQTNPSSTCFSVAPLPTVGSGYYPTSRSLEGRSCGSSLVREPHAQCSSFPGSSVLSHQHQARLRPSRFIVIAVELSACIACLRSIKAIVIHNVGHDFFTKRIHNIETADCTVAICCVELESCRA
ncbi:hypothetical protein V6N11_059284 [Hibiscus sabdariffa]|uniref:Uncharacterized protein n=1 Tax=Hibiscus sabdariffa TaxID=183260 RepID=A0ABR2U6P3_9ROSI